MSARRGTVSPEKRRLTSAKRMRDYDDEDDIQIISSRESSSFISRRQSVKQEQIESPPLAQTAEAAAGPSTVDLGDTQACASESTNSQVPPIEVELPTTRFVVLKDKGDVIIETTFTTTRGISHISTFLCSSLAICNLGGKLITLLEEHDGGYRATLKYHDMALEAILRIAHLQSDRIPLPPDEHILHRYVKLALSLEVWSTMAPWLRRWTYSMFVRRDPDQHWLEWLCLSWHMGYPHTFERQIQRCVLNSCQAGDDTLVIQRGNALPMSTYRPLMVICGFEHDEIQRLRHELLADILGYLCSVLKDPALPRCKAHFKKSQCSALQKGQVLQRMELLGLTEKPAIDTIRNKPVSIWHGILSIEPPNLLGDDHKDCDLFDTKTELSRIMIAWTTSPFRADGRASEDCKQKFREHFKNASIDELLRSVPHVVPSIEASGTNEEGFMLSRDDFEDEDWDPEYHPMKTYVFDVDGMDLEEMRDEMKHLGPTRDDRRRKKIPIVVDLEQ